jgi:hypothetical protein
VDKRRRSGIDKRRKPRHARRLACELWLAGSRQSGIVKDVSEIGLYVQTRLKASRGTRITVVFPASGLRPEIRIEARVARTDRVRSHLATQSATGLGLEVPAGSLAPLLADLGEALRAS